ncbi:hypothetical protein QL989_14575 [Pseudoalteromonas sp. APC 3224]|uniref:hypothetical protein n=1 Tax=Pseudoalteromonas sp. APC 3224 TaxID=3035203 RepID=UPI0025B45945|nr:hypothetical protein [Pseudoalteromonas sp. APC 3224]MDN3486565.1 hypothetical protein [Pseudoalteromonas sp. APC 3224]
MFKYIGGYSLLFFGATFLYLKCNLNISYGSYKDFLLVLLNVSSMVFTLMGIWIAFLYPNALKRIVNPKVVENVDFSESLSETRRLESIVGSVLKSAMVVVSIVAIFLMKLLVPSFSAYANNIQIFEAIAVALVLVLTLLQLESVFHVVKSNVMFINDLHRKREDKEADHDV